jgi:hypothetical protein
MRAVASISARWENACGKFPRKRAREQPHSGPGAQWLPFGQPLSSWRCSCGHPGAVPATFAPTNLCVVLCGQAAAHREQMTRRRSPRCCPASEPNSEAARPGLRLGRCGAGALVSRVRPDWQTISSSPRSIAHSIACLAHGACPSGTATKTRSVQSCFTSHSGTTGILDTSTPQDGTPASSSPLNQCGYYPHELRPESRRFPPAVAEHCYFRLNGSFLFARQSADARRRRGVALLGAERISRPR